jgi:hypothetical protein
MCHNVLLDRLSRKDFTIQIDFDRFVRSVESNPEGIEIERRRSSSKGYSLDLTHSSIERFD